MKRIVLLMLALSSPAWGQGVLFTAQALTTVQVNGVQVLSAQAYAPTTVCLLSNSTCTATTVYSDQAMTQPLTQPFPADKQGNITFFAPGGTYQYTFCPVNSSNCYTYDIAASSVATLGKVATTNQYTDLTNDPSPASVYDAFGDSITCGYIAPSPPPSPPYSRGEDCTTATAYPSLIATDTGLTLNNYAIPGDMAADIWPRQIGPGAVSPSLAAGSPVFSLMIGTNDANGKGVGSYESVFNLTLRAAVAWLAIPAEYKTLPNSSTVSNSGWTISSNNIIGGYALSSTAGQTIQFPITTYGYPIYVWYTINDAAAPSSTSGTITYRLDSGTPVSITTQSVPAMATQNGTTNSVAVIRLPATAGSHTVTFANVSGTVAVLGVGTAPANLYFQHPEVTVGDVPEVSGVSLAPVIEYSADVLANVNLLKGDGLDVRFASNHSYFLGTLAEEQSDHVHPTALGAQHYAQAFSAIMQPTFLGTPLSSYSARFITGNDTVLSTDSDLYAACTAACTLTLPKTPWTNTSQGQHIHLMATGSNITIAAASGVTLNEIPSGYTILQGSAYSFAAVSGTAWSLTSQPLGYSLGTPTLTNGTNVTATLPTTYNQTSGHFTVAMTTGSTAPSSGALFYANFSPSFSGPPQCNFSPVGTAASAEINPQYLMYSAVPGAFGLNLLSGSNIAANTTYTFTVACSDQ